MSAPARRYPGRLTGGQAPRSPSTDGAAYAACAWALVFAAMSVYWAGGGAIGINTLSGSVTRLPGIVALLWGIAAVKGFGGLFALALVRPWGRMIPRRLLLTGAWVAGLGLSLYGGIPLIVNGLMLSGVLNVPGPRGLDGDPLALRAVGSLVPIGRPPF